MYDLNSLRKLAVDVLDRGDRSAQRISVIVVVEGVEECTVLSDKCGLCCSRACIDAEECLPAVGRQILYRDLVLRMTGSELFVFFRGGKERIQTFYLHLHLYLCLQTVLKFAERNGHLLFGIQGRADGSEQVRVVRSDRVLVIQFQRADERGAQFGEEMKRSSEKGNVSADRFAAGESADSLIHNGLENGRRKVFLGSSVVDQRLNVGLGEYTAAGRDGIKRLVMLCIFVQAGRICLQKRRHLVNKRACTASTDTIHPLFDITAFEIDDLGIFAAQFDGYVCLRSIVLQSR